MISYCVKDGSGAIHSEGTLLATRLNSGNSGDCPGASGASGNLGDRFAVIPAREISVMLRPGDHGSVLRLLVLFPRRLQPHEKASTAFIRCVATHYSREGNMAITLTRSEPAYLCAWFCPLRRGAKGTRSSCVPGQVCGGVVCCVVQKSVVVDGVSVIRI